eukprot:scaffold201600_cov30-Tisochrysis_lutea.AAC.2
MRKTLGLPFPLLLAEDVAAFEAIWVPMVPQVKCDHEHRTRALSQQRCTPHPCAITEPARVVGRCAEKVQELALGLVAEGEGAVGVIEPKVVIVPRPQHCAH